MLKKIFLAFLFLGALGLPAQKTLVWQMLEMTTYRIMNESEFQSTYLPEFPAILEAEYANREVVIAGYLIPVDIEARKYALSKNPFTSCFFCGGAGPETVIELRFKESPGRFATDEFLMIKGQLRLNRSGSGLFFILENAEVHG
jgi:hypothetical protein